MDLLQRKLYFFQGSRGFQHFPGGEGGGRGGGSKIRISIAHITCDFSRGGPGPDPPYPPSASEHGTLGPSLGPKIERSLSRLPNARMLNIWLNIKSNNQNNRK